MMSGVGLPPEVFDLRRQLTAQALGMVLLLAVVLGSGIMGERLALPPSAFDLLRGPC